VTERTGLGIVEVAILQTLEGMNAQHDRPYRKSANVLNELERSHGIGPRYGYAVLCDLAHPWMVWVPLIDPHGNFGNRDFPAAHPRYTECRLTPAGTLAAAAERGAGPALPIDLLNGSLYRGGTRPPFAPTRLIDALLMIVHDPRARDEEIMACAGPPAFATRCEVGGEIDALVAGRGATLKCRATIERASNALVLTTLPPGIGCDEVSNRIVGEVNESRLRLRDLRDEASSDDVRLVCQLQPGDDPAVVEAHLRRIWGVTITIGCDLGAPLASLLRTWVAEHAVDGTAAALQNLRTLVASD
jgi:DNA gyrase/topoisomerase IV subunit A